jgi:hypothetical protein
MFAAAVFGVVAVLSLPVGRLYQGPLGRILPWSGPLGGVLHGALSPPPGPGVRASGPADANGPGGPGFVSGPGGGSFGSTSGSVTGGGPVPAPDPRPRPGPNQGNLKDRISDLDRATLALLDQLVGNRNLHNVLGRLSKLSDRRDATATLLALTAQDRWAELQSRVTPAQLHMLLQDIRDLLVTIIPRLPADWRHQLAPPAGGWFGAKGTGPSTGPGASRTWSPGHASVPKHPKHARAAKTSGHPHHHKK